MKILNNKKNLIVILLSVFLIAMLILNIVLLVGNNNNKSQIELCFIEEADYNQKGTFSVMFSYLIDDANIYELSRIPVYHSTSSYTYLFCTITYKNQTYKGNAQARNYKNAGDLLYSYPSFGLYDVIDMRISIPYELLGKTVTVELSYIYDYTRETINLAKNKVKLPKTIK